MKKTKKLISIFICISIFFTSMCTFSFTASAKTVDSYTVLILDTSGSMDGEPISALKEVAKKFCASLLGSNTTNEIAIVEFNNTCTSIDFTNDYSTLKSKIESLEATGGTNMYEALIIANALLSLQSSNSDKNIVLLTDGVPQRGEKSSDGPYTSTGSDIFQYRKYANAVYNLMETYKQSYNIYTVGFFHKSSSTLAKNLLNDINNKGYYNAQNSDELSTLFSKIANSVNKKTPKDYNFSEDSYNFKNYTKSISKSYFTTIYEPASADALYKKNKDCGNTGLCFGMSYTTAAIYNGFPAVERWTNSTLTGTSNASCIRDIKKNSSYIELYNGNGKLSIGDYIKYAHIYQCSSNASTQKNANINNVSELYNMVKTYTENDQIGVVIGIWHYQFDKNGNIVIKNGKKQTIGGHAILAVGVDGNDILIDDPNSTDSLKRLTINSDNTWSYNNPWESDGINSKNSYITYLTDIFKPYQIILTGNKTTAPDSARSNESAGSVVCNMERLDSNHTLVTFDNEIAISGTEIVAPVSYSIGTTDDTDSADEIFAYWVEDSDNITVTNNSDSENEIQVAKDNYLVSANINSEDVVILTDDNVSFQTNSNNNLSFSISDVYNIC